MKTLVKKEIRLVLPAWIVAVLLAMVQGITRPYDFYVASLLFFGLTLMALTTIGRESSLNTFSSLLAQPQERVRIWQVKLAVLSAAFLTVFAVWLAGFGIAFVGSHVDESDRENTYNLFITVCLIAAATFTGGLWTTLLLRQLAGAFWLTLLVPATLSGFSAIFLANSDSSHLVIAVLSVVIGVYSLAGFLFARWLYFRAQDVGWSGGVINLPEWKFLLARAGTTVTVRTRRPVFALLKKELLLQQGVLTGAVGVLVLHVGSILLRLFHHFSNDEYAIIQIVIVWIFWMVLPALMGSIAVADERKLGVTEGQMCLPVSRRRQFWVKFLVVLSLGVLLGGVMPVVLERIGAGVGVRVSLRAQTGGMYLLLGMGTAAWITVVSFFASSLAKNFLQALGIALMTFVGFMMFVPAFTNNRMIFYDSINNHSLLLLIIAVPVLPIALLWLAYRNYARFREGWPLWRRQMFGVGGAGLFILGSANVTYHRAWEFFEPAEPAHGAAKMSLAAPPTLSSDRHGNLLVHLPDGRVWFDYLDYPLSDSFAWWRLLRWSWSPLPVSVGPQKFLSGSNWLAAFACHFHRAYDVTVPGLNRTVYISSFSDSVGIQQDGTLWVSDKSESTAWTADKLAQFGNSSDWQQLAAPDYFAPVMLLKKNGTLWEWGPAYYDLRQAKNWPGLRAYQPRQVGTNSDWTKVSVASGGNLLAQKGDGSVWGISLGAKRDGITPAINFPVIPSSKAPLNYPVNHGAYVRDDGTLWVYENVENHRHGEFKTWQSGQDHDWVAVEANWEWMVALKSDGTLWKWSGGRDPGGNSFTCPPTRLGVHNDWVALAESSGNVVTLAADGSLWLWAVSPDWEYESLLLQLPKRPQFLGNVFRGAN